MNTAKNLDSFNSTSPLFRDLSDDQAAQVSGGTSSTIYLNEQQAQGLLGGDYDSDERYTFITDTDLFRYSIYSLDEDEYEAEDFVNGSLTLTPEQTRQFGFHETIHQATLSLSADGIISGAASPAIATRPTSR